MHQSGKNGVAICRNCNLIEFKGNQCGSHTSTTETDQRHQTLNYIRTGEQNKFSFSMSLCIYANVNDNHEIASHNMLHEFGNEHLFCVILINL